MSVAMVMPLTGFDELPISPLMRDATVTNRKPKTITSSAAMRLENRPVLAPGIGLNVRSAHIIAIITMDPISTNFIGKSYSRRSACAAMPERLARTSFSPAVSALKICRQRSLQQRDQSGRSRYARADRANVGGPQLVRSHLRDGNRRGIKRARHILAEETDRRHQDQPRKNAARENRPSGFRPDDVADAEIFRK